MSLQNILPSQTLLSFPPKVAVLCPESYFLFLIYKSADQWPVSSGGKVTARFFMLYSFLLVCFLLYYFLQELECQNYLHRAFSVIHQKDVNC